MGKKDPYVARKKDVQRTLAGVRRNKKICTTKGVISKLKKEFPNVSFKIVGSVAPEKGLYMYKMNF